MTMDGEKAGPEPPEEEGNRNVENAVVVEVKPDDRIARLGLLRLFLDASRTSLGIEFNYAIALRLFHLIGEHGGAPWSRSGAFEQGGQLMTMEEVVSQHERD